MSTIPDELFGIADRLEGVAAAGKASEIEGPIRAVEAAADEVGKAWGGSWFGYQSRVYYRDLAPAPPGAHFDKQWGFPDAFSTGTVGAWAEYEADGVRRAIHERAGDPDLGPAKEFAKSARGTLEDCRAEMVSLLTTATQEREDPFLAKLKEEAEGSKPFGASDFVNLHSPTGQFVGWDHLALSQGIQVPPHIAELAEAVALLSPGTSARSLPRWRGARRRTWRGGSGTRDAPRRWGPACSLGMGAPGYGRTSRTSCRTGWRCPGTSSTASRWRG